MMIVHNSITAVDMANVSAIFANVNQDG